MGRTRGSKNIRVEPETSALNDEERMALVADMLLALVTAEIDIPLEEEPCTVD